MEINRRTVMLAGLSLPMLASPLRAAGTKIEVFKDPSCGCCTAWIDHVRSAGFEAVAREVEQDRLWALKAKAGITADLASCHTAFIDGYVIEGHVPAKDIQRLLDDRPDAIGLSVPGMPIGSPGMEMGDEREAFDTLLIRKGEAPMIFARHG